MRVSVGGFMADHFPTFVSAGWWLARVIPRAFVLFLILLVVAAIPWTYFNIKYGRQLEARLAALKAAGEPVTIMDAVPKPVPDEQNAAVVYEEVFRVGHIWPEPEQRPPNPPIGPRKQLSGKLTHRAEEIVPDAQTRAALRSSEAQHVLEVLRRGSERPYCVFPVNWDDGFGALFPHLAELREATRVVAAHSRILAEEGRVDEALDWCLVSLRMSRHAQDEHHLIGQLIAYSMQHITFDALREIVSPGDIPSEASHELDQWLRSADLAAGFDAAMGMERAFGCDLYKLLRREPRVAPQLWREPPHAPSVLVRLYCSRLARPLQKLDQLVYLERMQEQRERLSKPYRHAADQETKPEGKPFAPVAASLVPSFTKAMRNRDYSEAQIGLCRVVLALKAYKYESGGYPASLKQLQRTLEYALPKDPFSGKDFLYKRQGEAFKVYSLGWDLDDDGGTGPEDNGRGWDNFDIVWECTR